VAASLLATDSTGLPVLDEDVPNGIRNGTMWCWVGDGRWVTFFYSKIGDSQSVKDFLGEDLCRTVQCDGTSLTSFLERTGGKRPGCWAHGRRRLVECARGGDTLAMEGLRLIRRIERRAQRLVVGERARRERREPALPLRSGGGRPPRHGGRNEPLLGALVAAPAPASASAPFLARGSAGRCLRAGPWR
jgi:hypothetical protein